jgi:hypothetical protein
LIAAPIADTPKAKHVNRAIELLAQGQPSTVNVPEHVAPISA